MFLKWSISQMEHFSNGAILKSNISQMEHFSNEAILKSNISQMEHFSNGAILKSNISQMEQFSNGAFWGRHPMPYFKIPRTEKYGMRCASTTCKCEIFRGSSKQIDHDQVIALWIASSCRASQNGFANFAAERLEYLIVCYSALACC